MNRIINIKNRNKTTINYREDFDVGNNVEHFHVSSGGSREAEGTKKEVLFRVPINHLKISNLSV